MTLQINQLLHRIRLPVAAVALLFILYCNVYMWFYVPPDDYEFTWSPDTQLRILSVPEGSLAKPYLQADDRIIAIDGHSVRRMGVLYPVPLQPAYQYTVQRGADILTYEVPVPKAPTSLAVRNQLPTTLLSLMGWMLGALLLFLARRDNEQALHAGYIFLLAPIVLVGIQAGQDGTPLAWLGGQALIFCMMVAWPYLGLIPRQEPLGINAGRILKTLLLVAAGLSLIAIYEVLYLYPRGQSMAGLYGISMYSSGLLLAAIGLFVFAGLLTWRAFVLPDGSYLRQQLFILLLFVAIGVFPIVFLTILPGVLLRTIFLPFPMAIALMSFIPAGYLFVIYRRGFLGLDPFFSRTIYLTLLALVVFGFYTGGLYVVQRLLNLGGPEVVVPATVIFFPTLLLAIYLNQPINNFVQQLVYGKVVLDQETLAEYALALSARPEIGTLDRTLTALSDMLGSSYAVLILRNRAGQFVQIAARGLPDAEVDTEAIPEFHEPVIRAALSRQAMSEVLALFQWAEVAVPLKAREEQIGALVLSKPGPDGYFNAKQITYLMQAASMLAVASENIRLFEATRSLSMRVQVAQEQERQRLALEIHDVPLQEITFATNTIDHLLLGLDGRFTAGAEDAAQNVAVTLTRANEHLRAAAMTLRNICIGLYPPSRDQGIHVVVQTIAHAFRERHRLKIDLLVDDDPHLVNIQGSEATVLAVSHVLGEALTNVAKHALGAHVRVCLKVDESNLCLSVVDNGAGMPIRSLSELIRHGHLGIVGMHEWARYAGGQLEIRRGKPRGLEVLLTCPLLTRPATQPQ